MLVPFDDTGLRLDRPNDIGAFADEAVFTQRPRSSSKLWITNGDAPAEVLINADIDEYLVVDDTLYGYEGRTLYTIDSDRSVSGYDLSDNLNKIQYLFDFEDTLWFRGRDSTTHSFYTFEEPSLSIKPFGVVRGGDSLFISQDSVGTTQFYYTYFDRDIGYELWVSDGTTGQLVADILPGSQNSVREAFSDGAVATRGDDLFFVVDDGTGSRDDLWITDGSEAGTRRLSGPGTPVGEIKPWQGAGRRDSFLVEGDKLFFSAGTPSGGVELYVSDGTLNGTKLVADIIPGADSSQPEHFFGAGGLLFFSPSRGPDDDSVFATDGTPGVVRKISDPGNAINGTAEMLAIVELDLILVSERPDFIDVSDRDRGVSVSALGGNDTLIGSRFGDELNGDASNDLIDGGAGNDLLRGGTGNDTLTGRRGNDNLSGDGGNDFIFGENGRDALRGGAQNDRLFGGNGADTILGEAGNDLLNGGTGRDLLLGGAGDDNLFGGAGIDTINGGAGNDVITLTDALDVVVGGSGIDTVRTASVSINLANTVSVERAVVFGQQDFRLLADSNGAVANTLFGNAGDNVIAGFAGNDLLGGNAGNDRLIGGPGNDVLIGGFGRDLLEGGGGRDQFRYDAVGDSRPGATRDVIVGFQNGDRINLAPLDADVRAGGNQAFTSVGSAGFTGAGGEVRYKVAGESTFVQVDITGSRSPDLEILLREFTDLGDASFIF